MICTCQILRLHVDRKLRNNSRPVLLFFVCLFVGMFVCLFLFLFLFCFSLLWVDPNNGKTPTYHRGRSFQGPFCREGVLPSFHYIFGQALNDCNARKERSSVFKCLNHKVQYHPVGLLEENGIEKIYLEDILVF